MTSSPAPAPAGDDETRVLAPTPPAPPTTQPKTARDKTSGTSGRSNKGLVAVLVGVLALVLVLGAVLATRGNDDNTPTAASPSASASKSSSPSAKNSPTKKSEPSPTPTAQGMDSFIRSYVATVSTNPDEAWPMLTPKFQRESGGLAKYRKFWGGVGTGHVLHITADPHTLVVSYRVKFDNFGSGKRPTVLKLVYRDGRYFIDGESTQDGA